MNSVTVIIPAYNEEDRIGTTLQAVKSIQQVDRIIVINDGSRDRTAEVARSSGVELIDLPQNRGKGGAMNEAVRLVDSDITVFLDADLGEKASEARLLIEAIVRGDADLAIAAFPPPAKKGGFGLVKGTAAWVIKRVGNMDSIAPLSGQRAMTREVLKAVSPFNEGYGVELGMTMRALMDGYRVKEVPTLMTHRETGRDLAGFIHRGRQFVDVIRTARKELKERGL